LRAAALALLTAAALAPAAASASTTMESTFQDDNLLVYGTPATMARTMDTLHALGADRLRISVFWNLVAPSPTSRRRPAFNASDPAAYPAGVWDRYDRIVRAARSLGLSVNFDITSPAPFWATGRAPEAKIQKDFEPSPSEFGQFVRAVGTRYSGSYVPPGSTTALPRVDYWAFWNEPNQAGWLTPQWIPDPHRKGAFVEHSPRIYRALVDGAYAGLLATGHGSDTILIGETAPKGLDAQGTTRSMKAMRFIRRLYCLDDGFNQLRGASAAILGCPTTAAGSRTFATDHPGLFSATGFAHHPYELTFAPDRPPSDRDFATIANLPALTQALARILRVYHVARPGLPLYLTEFGYQTNPPDPLGVTLAQQAAYLDESEFIAYNNPTVRTLSQFLLVDDRPLAGVSDPIAAYGGTFQSGLEFQDGRRKPSYSSYRMPIFISIPRARSGHAIRLWGMTRAGPRDGQLAVTVQFEKAGSRSWKPIAQLQAEPLHGFIDARVRVTASGRVRLAWTSPAGSHQTIYSRSVSIRVT
jgi:hypothetical protein